MNGVQLLLVLLGSLAVTAWARRTDRQAPLLVTAVGIAVSFIPGLPRFEIDAEVILAVVVPPLLYSTALGFSLPSFKRSLRPIMMLGAGMVLATWAVMYPIIGGLIPALAGFGAWIAAAVIAPPDAVTAVSIGRKLGLPRRLMTVLTGESLVNDAMALTLFTLGVAKVTGEQTISDNILVMFGYGAAVGVVVGVVIGWLVQQIRRRLSDPMMETVFGLIVPFAAYLAAEELHASGVLAVVAAGLYLGHRSATADFTTRITERGSFEVMDVLLEALVFGYMGLQLRFVVQEVTSSGSGAVLGWSLLVLVIVMAVRLVYAYGAEVWRRIRNWLHQRGLRRHLGNGRPGSRRSATRTVPWNEVTVVGWTGMRGVVTVAAAAGVPHTLPDGSPFPGRLEIQVVAYVVAIGTLLIQGVTLPGLIRRLHISDPQGQAQVDAERQRAAVIGREAALQVLVAAAEHPPAGVDPAALAVFRTQTQRMVRAWEGADREDTEEHRWSGPTRQLLGGLRHKMLQAQRSALIAERDAGRLDDEVMREVLEQLDLEQAAVQGRTD